MATRATRLQAGLPLLPISNSSNALVVVVVVVVADTPSKVERPTAKVPARARAQAMEADTEVTRNSPCMAEDILSSSSPCTEGVIHSNSSSKWAVAEWVNSR